MYSKTVRGRPGAAKVSRGGVAAPIDAAMGLECARQALVSDVSQAIQGNLGRSFLQQHRHNFHLPNGGPFQLLRHDHISVSALLIVFMIHTRI